MGGTWRLNTERDGLVELGGQSFEMGAQLNLRHLTW